MDIFIESAAREYIRAKSPEQSVTIELVERPGGT